MLNVSRFVFLLFGFVLLAIAPQTWANVLEGVRVWPSPDETRVVLDVKSEVDYSYFTLSSPERLVVDLKQSTSRAKLPVNVTESGILSKVRASSPPEKSTFRLVFELKQKTTPTLFKLAPTPGGQYGHRLVIDMPHGKVSESSSASTPSSPAQVSKDASQLLGNDDIVVAIDAGHGGEDPGSIGPTRKYEKDITLSVSKKLADQLNAVPGMKAVLTRRANTEIARWVENHEQQSELLGGAGEVLSKTNNDRNVSQTLLDLQFSHSQKEGYKVATNILREMGKVAHLHKTEPVNASLAVLKSPDIPSVLVETGFISNPSEEKLLIQRSHQDKLARALATAIVQYFEDNPPEGTLFANRGKAQKHKVQRGESIGLIANQYGVSVDALKKANNLKSSTISVGQLLTIPASSAPNPVPVPVMANPVETETITHVVKTGDFLGKLATTYKVSVASIKKENNLKSDTLVLGQKLKITVSLKDKPLRKHKVQRGEFLSKIADQYNVSVDSIRQANQLRTDQLLVGQQLIIPNK
ncbi:TPA: LysM peptidoglycan-binding domain-containing protein [Vibrio cholerae]|nr:LysM peptidoglycan-binding domain-containing protein [Vibrio cholerae]